MRTLLYAMLIMGLAGLTGQGTFATFSAEITNSGDFATGTLVMSNKKNTATACLSTAGGTTDVNGADCDVLFSFLTAKSLSSNARVTIANLGSVDISSLRLTWAGGTTPCQTVDEPTEAFHGTGDMCGAMRVQVQEYPTAATQTGNDRGLDPISGLSSVCWFGGGAGTDTCSYNNNEDLAKFSLESGVGANYIDMGALPAGSTRWYRIYVQIPAGQFTNAMQGRRVDFGFTWTGYQ